MTFFTRTGDHVNYTDQSKFLLTVNGVDIDLSTGYFSLEDLTVSYDSKELSFSEIILAPTTYGEPTYNGNHTVVLKMNLDGTGFKTYFRGRIRKVQHVGKNQDEAILYTAFGFQQLADEVDAIGELGLPNIEFPNGYWPVSWILEYIFDWNSTRLTDQGLGATVGTPSYSAFFAYVDNLNLSGLGVVSALKKAASFEATRRVFWDDITETWIFPTVHDATIVDLGIADYNYEDASFTVDLTNRYTSLLMVGPYTSTMTFSQREMIDLTEGWDPAYQADWTIKKAQGMGAANGFGDAYAWVFRRWTFSPTTSSKPVQGSERLTCLIPWNRTTRWVHVAARINWKLGEVLAQVPVLCLGDPENENDDHYGPLDAKLTYLSSDLAPIGGVAFILTPSIGGGFGGSDYAGTAYSVFGIARQKILVVGTEQLTIDEANDRFAVISDAIITAEIPIWGDPMHEFIDLQKRITVTHPTKTTGMEDLPGMVIRYKHTFGKPGKNTISVTNDRATITRAR